MRKVQQFVLLVMALMCCSCIRTMSPVEHDPNMRYEWYMGSDQTFHYFARRYVKIFTGEQFQYFKIRKALIKVDNETVFIPVTYTFDTANPDQSKWRLVEIVIEVTPVVNQ